MGLYLCIFDEDEEEIDGVEIGFYADFSFFREMVVAQIEGDDVGSVCPVLNIHSDCDGIWNPEESEGLLLELEVIEKHFLLLPAVEFNSPWKAEVAKSFGIKPRSLYECFFDIDGEPLIERLKGLAAKSVAKKLPILFQ